MSEQFNWNKQIAIRVKTVGPGTIQRRQLVMVSVCVSHKAPSNLKVLSIKLTDENDPFFLFQMEIGEEEFPSLKSEQNLLVDFTNFPVKFIELLEECNRCDSSSSDCEKFIARLSVDPSGHQNNTLTIMETNTFKQIVHLSLSFTAGNDESLKKYLSGLVNVFKNECLRLKEQLVSKEQTFQNEMKALVSENLSIKQTLESCRFEYADRESRLKLQHAELQTEERMKIVNEKENELREKQRELNELISKFDKQRLELSATVRDLQSQNSALKNQKEVCEDQLSSSKSRLDSFQLELQTCKSELNKLTSEKYDWKNTETNLRNSLHMNLEKIQNLEQMVADKTSKITFLEENNSSLSLQTMKYEDTISTHKMSIASLNDQVDVLQGEISKANEIIVKLQGENSTLKRKVRSSTSSALQNEKLLTERQVSLEKINSDFLDLKNTVTLREQEISELKREISVLKQNLEDEKKVNQENHNIIEWLHKQNNEKDFRKDEFKRSVSQVEYKKNFKYDFKSNEVTKPSSVDYGINSKVPISSISPIGNYSNFLQRNSFKTSQIPVKDPLLPQREKSNYF